MVFVWYPSARSTIKHQFQRILPGAQQIDTAPGFEWVKRGFGTAWSLIVSGNITSNAHERAPMVQRRFPVVLFSSWRWSRRIGLQQVLSKTL